MFTVRKWKQTMEKKKIEKEPQVNNCQYIYNTEVFCSKKKKNTIKNSPKQKTLMYVIYDSLIEHQLRWSVSEAGIAFFCCPLDATYLSTIITKPTSFC